MTSFKNITDRFDINTTQIFYRVVRSKIDEIESTYVLDEPPRRENVELESKVIGTNLRGVNILPLRFLKSTAGLPTVEIQDRFLKIKPEKNLIRDSELVKYSESDFTFFDEVVNVLEESPSIGLLDPGTIFRVPIEGVQEKEAYSFYQVTDGNRICAMPNAETVQVNLVERDKTYEDILVIEPVDFKSFDITGTCPDRTSDWIPQFAEDTGFVERPIAGTGSGESPVLKVEIVNDSCIPFCGQGGGSGACKIPPFPYADCSDPDIANNQITGIIQGAKFQTDEIQSDRGFTTWYARIWVNGVKISTTPLWSFTKGIRGNSRFTGGARAMTTTIPKVINWAPASKSNKRKGIVRKNEDRGVRAIAPYLPFIIKKEQEDLVGKRVTESGIQGVSSDRTVRQLSSGERAFGSVTRNNRQSSQGPGTTRNSTVITRTGFASQENVLDYESNFWSCPGFYGLDGTEKNYGDGDGRGSSNTRRPDLSSETAPTNLEDYFTFILGCGDLSREKERAANEKRTFADTIPLQDQKPCWVTSMRIAMNSDKRSPDDEFKQLACPGFSGPIQSPSAGPAAGAPPEGDPLPQNGTTVERETPRTGGVLPAPGFGLPSPTRSSPFFSGGGQSSGRSITVGVPPPTNTGGLSFRRPDFAPRDDRFGPSNPNEGTSAGCVGCIQGGR